MNAVLASRADWYLMRATGIVSLILLTCVVALGIVTAKRWKAPQLPLFVTAQVHRSVSLLAVVFLSIHMPPTLRNSLTGRSL